MAKGSILSTKVPPDDMLEACVLTRGSVLNQQRTTLNAGVAMAGDTSLLHFIPPHHFSVTFYCLSCSSQSCLVAQLCSVKLSSYHFYILLKYKRSIIIYAFIDTFADQFL